MTMIMTILQLLKPLLVLVMIIFLTNNFGLLTTTTTTAVIVAVPVPLIMDVYCYNVLMHHPLPVAIETDLFFKGKKEKKNMNYRNLGVNYFFLCTFCFSLLSHPPFRDLRAPSGGLVYRAALGGDAAVLFGRMSCVGAMCCVDPWYVRPRAASGLLCQCRQVWAIRTGTSS